MESNCVQTQDDTTLSTIIRWRIVDGRIVLRERRIRSLEPLNLSPPLTAWIRSRLEWAADNLLSDGSEGVLCLAINSDSDVVVSLEDIRACPTLTMADFLELDGSVASVCHEDIHLESVVFCELDGVLYASAHELTSAPATLVADLASTLGLPLVVAPMSREFVAGADAAFLVSDEFGFVPIDLGRVASEVPLSTKIAACLAKVFLSV